MMLPLTLTYVRGEQRRTTVRRSARIKGSKQGPCPKQGSRRSCPSGPWSSRVQLCCSTESGYYLLRCVSFRLRASLRAVQAQPTQPGRDAARSWSFAIARNSRRDAPRTPVAHSRPRPPSRRAAPETRAPGSSGVSKELDVETPRRDTPPLRLSPHACDALTRRPAGAVDTASESQTAGHARARGRHLTMQLAHGQHARRVVARRIYEKQVLCAP